jgi:hypothetical protein
MSTEPANSSMPPDRRRRFKNPVSSALLGFGRRRPLLGALVQALLFTTVFCALLALRLHGEPRVRLAPAAAISFVGMFIWMLAYNVYSLHRSKTDLDG